MKYFMILYFPLQAPYVGNFWFTSYRSKYCPQTDYKFFAFLMERKVATKTITFGVGRPGVPSHGQKCLDLIRCLRLVMARRKIIAHNERFIDF